MIHLKSIQIRPQEAIGGYPYSLPLVQQFGELELDSPMTVLVGENGSGKSTVLEAVAASIGLPSIGGHNADNDPTLGAARELAKAMRLAWNQNPHRGFFLRAEDFFNFARRMNDTRNEMDEILQEYEGKEGAGWDAARGYIAGQRDAIEKRYDGDLDARSHGESFLTLFQSRFVPNGLYILDEPEAPLSPQRQLTLISMMKQMIEEQSSQFIMATHSPILMGFPNAKIISFDDLPPRLVNYEDTEHVRLTRDFLADREAFLRHL